MALHPVERRQTPHDRQRVAVITSIWAALALLAAAAALLQPEVDGPPPPPTQRVAAAPPAPPAPAPDATPGSWLGVMPNNSEPLEPQPATF